MQESRELVALSSDLICRWLSKIPTKDKKEEYNAYDSFSPHQRILFLDILTQASGKLAHEQLKTLDEMYNLTENSNVEILLRWFVLCLRANYHSVVNAAVSFACHHGRMKYCRPIYQ